MADYSESKSLLTNSYPVESTETSNLLTRVEPLLTPEQLISRYLKGIPLPAYSIEELQDEIMLAINNMEIMSGLFFTRTQFQETLPFDPQLYKNYIHIMVKNRPILSVEEFGFIGPTNDAGEEPLYFKIPPRFLAMGLAHRGQINITPWGPFFGGGGTSSGNNQMGLLPWYFFGQFPWQPQSMRIKYTSGLCRNDNDVPVVVNQVIGMTAAIQLLSARQTLNSYTSQSLSQDGISQSSGSQGPQIYQPRIELLAMERDKLLERIKNTFFQKRFVGNF